MACSALGTCGAQGVGADPTMPMGLKCNRLKRNRPCAWGSAKELPCAQLAHVPLPAVAGDAYAVACPQEAQEQKRGASALLGRRRRHWPRLCISTPRCRVPWRGI